MVRIYKRTFRNTRNGKNYKPYTNYSEEQLQTALQAVKDKTLSLASAAETYDVPKTTLWRKLVKKNCTQKKAGRPTLFSEKEEKCFIQHIKVVAEWGFPFDTTDLRIFAQKYLEKLGKVIYGLKDNMPGPDWARYFIERYKKELSNRMASNISTDRAKTTSETIDIFFENYIKTVEGVSPDCIINYDETNLTDDPGNKKYIYKRGTKYPERVINSSKTSISLMFSGTAAGQLLPIYVVYKADNLWDTWLEGGPEDTRYNRSKSGWFDGACFEDWFLKVIVPFAKSKPGRKIVVGDNLSSHFSANVLNTCEELNIAFVCLPPKTTHLLQPLDVAFYAPLKKYWRAILTQWKKIEGRKHKTLIKSCFPRLLAKLKNKLTENGVGSNNLIAGFNKTGLYPVNAERPKSRLPRSQMGYDEETYNNTSEVVTDMLQEMRGSVQSSEAPRRKKRCVVPPGQSITAADLLDPNISMKNPSKKNNSKGQVTKPLVDYPSSSSEENAMDSDITFVQTDISDYEIPYNLPGSSGLANKKSAVKAKETVMKKNKRSLKRAKTSVKVSKSPVVGKGKGIGKKTKVGKENLPCIANAETLNSKNITMRRKPRADVRKINRAARESSTSVSDCMSIHSDSDVIDVPENLFERDDYYEKFPFFTSAEMKKYTTNIYDGDDSSIGDICDDLAVIDSSYNLETMSKETNDLSNTYVPHQDMDVSFEEVNKSRNIDQHSAVLEVGCCDSIYGVDDDHIIEKSDIRNESEDQPGEEPSYSIGDYVLVRYYERKKWKYYVGTIETVKNEDDRMKYSIVFFKTVKKPELKFGITKKVDRDVVTHISIVKKLELTANSANSKELFLSDESDKVYFFE